MRKTVVVIAALIMGVTFYNFETPVLTKQSDAYKKMDSIPMTDNIQAIIEHSCFGCHNSESKSEKGKKKLQFDMLDSLSTFKTVGKLSDIHEVLEEGEMPPEKFLAKYPDRALTEEQKQALMAWAKETSASLTKK